MNGDDHQRQAVIGAILYELSTYWRNNPQQRFGQVIENMLGRCTKGGCIYAIIDSEWLAYMGRMNDKDLQRD